MFSILFKGTLVIHGEQKLSQTIKWENRTKNLCVICSGVLLQASYFICISCNQICKIMPIGQDKLQSDEKYIVLDIKSRCCNSDVLTKLTNTCSDKCHNDLIRIMENDFGKFKKVVDAETGIEHRVSTKDIVEKGLTHEELQHYPRW